MSLKVKLPDMTDWHNVTISKIGITAFWRKKRIFSSGDTEIPPCACKSYVSSIPLTTFKSLLATFPLDWSPLPVQSPIGSAQVLLNHFPTRLVTSSSQVSYWFSSSAPEPLSHSAGHLFQSSLLVVQLSSKLSKNP